MPIVNQSRPSSSLTNQTKIDIGLTWDAATMTWDQALFTWDSTVSLISNATKISSSITNVARPA
jgi:hypothetical protein